MKERVFYIVNLDKKRISVLAIFLTGLLFSFFFLGVSVGKGNAMVIQQKSRIADTMELSKTGLEPLQKNSEIVPTTSELQPETKQDEVTVEKSDSIDSTVTFANKAPETQVIELRSTPGEDTKKVETIHNSESVSLPSKHSPKKTSSHVESKGAFTIQLAAFSTKSEAEQFVKKIILDNPTLRSKPYVKTSGKYFVVRLGTSDDKIQLKKLLDNLKVDANIKKSAIIVKNS